MKLEKMKIAVIGLGYVGLPLSVAFAKKYKVIGFDINSKRINELQKCIDVTEEIEKIELESVLDIENSKVEGLFLTNNVDHLKESNIYIVTVPTPIDKNNKPDLTPMIKSSETIGSILKKGDIVIYESTVYPGVTEEVMAPILEFKSGLKLNKDFYCGYSPERINPGDKEHTVTKIKKVTSGSTKEVAEIVDNLYNSIITAGTYKASSIKVAEAAKVIENSQRDLNIAFINELSKIFNLIGIDTYEVLSAASTKWNFLNFKPGLVGGHCIGVDPFYLAQKAQEVGYHPELILAGRRMNDSMGKHVATELIKMMIRKDLNISKSKVLILGFTFKENCPDVRNTRVIDIYNELRTYNICIDVFDPKVDPNEVKLEYDIDVISELNKNHYTAIILAVAHSEFIKLNLRELSIQNGIIFDVKGVLPKETIDLRL